MRTFIKIVDVSGPPIEIMVAIETINRFYATGIDNPGKTIIYTDESMYTADEAYESFRARLAGRYVEP